MKTFFFDAGIKTFLTNGKPELHELAFVLTKPPPHAQVGVVTKTQSSTTTSNRTSASSGPQNKFCGECGAKNSVNDKFCGKCGKKL